MRGRKTQAYTKDEQKAAIAEGKSLQTRPNVYIVECDAYELPEFYERRDELIPKHNMGHIESIFGYNHHGGADWYGENCKSWDDAKRLIREGWPKGVERAAKLADKLQGILPEPESARRRPKWNDDDQGELDRDKLYSSGIDTAFRGNTRAVLRAPRVIRIVANWSMHAGYSADQIAWNGAAITALLDTLERADYSTELSLCFATEHYEQGGHVAMPVVRVKTAGDPLSLNAIAAVAGHAGIYRSFGFAAECSSPNQCQFGLGHCLQVKQAWEKAVAANVVETVDSYMEISTSEESAIDEMVRVLKHLFPEIKGLPMTKAEKRRIEARTALQKQLKGGWENHKAHLIATYGLEWYQNQYGMEEMPND